MLNAGPREPRDRPRGPREKPRSRLIRSCTPYRTSSTMRDTHPRQTVPSTMTPRSSRGCAGNFARAILGKTGRRSVHHVVVQQGQHYDIPVIVARRRQSRALSYRAGVLAERDRCPLALGPFGAIRRNGCRAMPGGGGCHENRDTRGSDLDKKSLALEPSPCRSLDGRLVQCSLYDAFPLPHQDPDSGVQTCFGNYGGSDMKKAARHESVAELRPVIYNALLNTAAWAEDPAAVGAPVSAACGRFRLARRRRILRRVRIGSAVPLERLAVMGEVGDPRSDGPGRSRD